MDPNITTTRRTFSTEAVGVTGVSMAIEMQMKQRSFCAENGDKKKSSREEHELVGCSNFS